MPTAKLSDAQPVQVPQSGTAKLSDAQPVDQNIDLKRKWYSMTPEQRKTAVVGMTPEELDQTMTALGTFGHATSMGKAPEFTGFGFRKVDIPLIGKETQFAPTPESVQWMKNKARSFLNWGQENLSNIAGPFGAHAGRIAGAAVGEGIAPEGGGIPGGYAGEIVGATLAGGAAEAVRQGLEHLEGVDKYNEPWENTPSERLNRITRAAEDQAVAQGVGMGLGRALRPTLKSSINNLYSAGMLDYGDPLAKKVTVGTGKSAYKSAGQLESVIGDVMKADEVATKTGKPTTTVEQLYHNIQGLKDEIGNEVSSKMSLPIRQGASIVPLRDATPNPTPLVDLIKDFATKDEGIVHRASLAGRDSSVTAAKKYQDMVKNRALTFQQKPWTYGLLANERQRINGELAEYYSMTPDGKSAFLKSHPLFEVDKAIANYIRDITYPEMDRLSGQPIGTTAQLQTKYGALKNINDQLVKRMGELATESRQGATKGVNASTYATPSGIGWSLHRLPLKLGMNDVEAQANRKVSRAFGHTLESKARKWIITTPFGSEVLGDNILSLPVRALIYYNREGDKGTVLSTRPTPKPPADQDDENGPQSSVSTPKELLQRAKQLNPAANGTVAYNHFAVNPKTGHRIASPDGKVWFDIENGSRVA